MFAGSNADNTDHMSDVEKLHKQILEMRELSERHGALLEINNVLVANLAQDDVFHKICRILKRMVPCDNAGLAIYDAERDNVRIVPWKANPQQEMQLLVVWLTGQEGLLATNGYSTTPCCATTLMRFVSTLSRTFWRLQVCGRTVRFHYLSKASRSEPSAWPHAAQTVFRVRLALLAGSG